MSPIAAAVNGTPITVHQVDLELSRTIRDREIQRPALRYLQAQALQQLIGRELILQWLQSRGEAASQSDVNLVVSRLEKQLAARERTLEQHLSERQLQREDLERTVRWQLSWERLLEQYLTDENLERYFRDHRAEFDGTRLRVAHILLAIDQAVKGDEYQRLLTDKLDFAARLRGKIASGDVSFAQAARLHSTAPTAAEGGDIGFIARNDPMPEPFSAAAYRLGVNDVSDPVITSIGVHLIRCLEVVPGQRAWTDVRDELERAVTQYLFEWAAGQNRQQAKIEFTGQSPHFAPGTRRLASNEDQSSAQ